MSQCTSNTKRAFVAELFAVALLITVSSPVLPAQAFRGVPGVRIRAMAAGASSGAGDIAAAVQLSNGMFVVADNVNFQLHYYSTSGRFIRTVGRRGSGPGEFQSVRWLGECGRDSVYAFDYMQNRISVFGVDGKLARTFSPPAGRTTYVRCTLDGTMLYLASSGLSGNTSRGAFQISDSTGKFLYRSPDLLLDEGVPLGKSIRIVIAPEGVAYGNGDSAFVTMMSARGEGRRRIPAGIAGREPTEANRNAALEYSATVIKGTQYEYQRMREMLRKLPPVMTLPAYSDLFIDVATKAIWVKTSNQGDPSTILERRGMDGAMQGTATLPPGLEIHQIRGDVVVAMVPDAKTGEETLVTYRLVK